MRKYIISLCYVTLFSLTAFSQQSDTATILTEVKITGYKSFNGIGHITEKAGEIIYAGKKNEILHIDSIDANKAINNTRQIIGRIPGANIIETEAGGFTANGIAFRGLNPYQSIEINTRQNGYNIAADITGYNEAYYLPPMEAVSRIEFIRGAAGLQFGSQIGGLVNYVLKDASAKPYEITTAQAIGSNGLNNSYASIGGTAKKIKYFGFIQYRNLDGWRQNSDQKQISSFVKIESNITPKLLLKVEYTSLRNRIHMPGGLTDSLFNANPRQSTRARNWLTSPWNIIASSLHYTFNPNTSLSLQTSFLFSNRSLVWRNEDGGPEAKDTIQPTLTYVPREVQREFFTSIINELRFAHTYHLGKQQHTLATGIRQAYSVLKRQGAGKGTTNTDFDLTLTAPYGYDLKFHTSNVALFAENIFHLTNNWSVTPGIRIEYLQNKYNGYTEDEDSAGQTLIVNPTIKQRTFALVGLGTQYTLNDNVNAYANYSQSYRPITYENLTPFGSVAHIDNRLKDIHAGNIDIGIRGMINKAVHFDISIFYIDYKNRISDIEQKDAMGNPYLFRTNTGDSRHVGIESYVEVNLSNILKLSSAYGKISMYNSYAFIHAKYVSGENKGNWVEYAPRHIERLGINYTIASLTLNMQYSFQSKAFGDAANTVYSPDALVGAIPSYKIMDISASYRIKHYQFRAGINNLTDNRYFTLRTPEYPGPGIIPANGRMLYAGITATF